MSRNALGRGLGDLLHRARPSRVVDRATTQEPAGPHPSLPGLDPTPTPEPPPAAKAPTELARAGGASLEPAPSGPRSEPSTPASAPDAQAPSGIPRFGPAYAPAPEPSATPGRLLLGTVLAIDAALILFAAVVAFGPWIRRPLSLYLAAAAVFVGGTLACAAVAWRAAPQKPPPQPGAPSRVRVRLTRL